LDDSSDESSEPDSSEHDSSDESSEPESSGDFAFLEIGGSTVVFLGLEALGDLAFLEGGGSLGTDALDDPRILLNRGYIRDRCVG